MTHVGWGKIILLGEHAVVYGYPALAAALDRGVTIAPVPTPAGGPLRLDVPAWNLSTSANAADAVVGDAHIDSSGPAGTRSVAEGRRGGAEPAHPIAVALAAIADHLEMGRPAVSLVGDAQIPPGAGLGSSAALAVAVARALLAYAKRPLDPALLASAAGASETVVHGRASGVDVALAIAGGLGVFRRASGLRPLSCQPLRVLVGSSGAPRSTAAMIARVASATSEKSDDARLKELGSLADGGTAALLGGDLPGLGAAMTRAHTLLAELGVSTPQLDSLCDAARATGAFGAKLTGAGGGGAVIAIAPREAEQAILTEWKHAGVTGFVATVRGNA
ncbi:MAG TPA: mevalonate kinase [Kofleriaceae bacterium]|jgi:mevalonate kinase